MTNYDLSKRSTVSGDTTSSAPTFLSHKSPIPQTGEIVVDGLRFANVRRTKHKNNSVGFNDKYIIKIEHYKHPLKLRSLLEEIEIIRYLNWKECVSCPILVSEGRLRTGERYFIQERIDSQRGFNTADMVLSILEQKSLGVCQGDLKIKNFIFDADSVCHIIDYDQAIYDKRFVQMGNTEYFEWIAQYIVNRWRKYGVTDFYNSHGLNRDEIFSLFKKGAFNLATVTIFKDQITTDSDIGIYHNLNTDKIYIEGARDLNPRLGTLDTVEFKKGEMVLDVGCNMGLLGHYLHDRGCVVTGIDMDRKIIIGAKMVANILNKNIQFKWLDIDEARIEQEYDTICLFSVIHHVKNFKRVTENIAQRCNRIILECGLKEHGSKPTKGGWTATSGWDFNSIGELVHYLETAFRGFRFHGCHGSVDRNRQIITLAKKPTATTMQVQREPPRSIQEGEFAEQQLSNESKYLVSTIVSTYNSGRFIRGCLEDLENQTIADRLEIIIVNSGSEENEETIVHEFQQKYDNIKYIRTDERETIYRAWNRAIKIASGKYITNANTDDRHSPEMFEKLATALDLNDDIAVVYSQFYITRVENQTWRNKTVEKIAQWVQPYSREQLLKMYFLGPQPMWRKSLHDEYGYFDETFKICGDYEFFLRVSQTHDFLLIPEPLGLYLLSPNSLGRTAGTREQEDQKIWELYRNNTDRIIRGPFVPIESCEVSLSESVGKKLCYSANGIAAEHTATVGSNSSALDYFLKAKDDFNKGNFISATKYINQYKALMDYSKLQRSLNTNTVREDNNIDISVIIVTNNRAEELQDCLKSLLEQEADCNFEVIVVDNGCVNIESFMQCVDQYIKCPINLNPSEGRNIGVRFARGNIIVFLDDDAVVRSDYVSSIKCAFNKYDIFGLRGRTYPKSSPVANNHVNICDLGDKPFPSYCNQEGNSAWLRDIYLSVDGMDPLLFGHEGSDLTYRIIQKYKKTNKVIYWPAAVIYHDYGVSEKLRKKRILYQLSANYLKYKHGTDIFVNWMEIKKYPIDLKKNYKLPEKVCSGRVSNPSSVISTERLHPRVSIVISCYNCAKFLPECLESIINQTMQEWELLLIDDGSTDGTRSIIEKYAQMDERIRPFYSQENKGPYFRRNFGIEHANSDFIVVQDADDIMCPSKLQMLYNEITKDDQIGIVGSFYYKFLEEFEGFEYSEKCELALSHEEIMRTERSRWDFCWHGSAIIRKSLFNAIGLYDENPFGSDSVWLAKTAEYAYYDSNVKFKNIPEFLTLRRVHADSQTGILPTFDPRSRRVKYVSYWQDKIYKIRERIQNNSGVDIAAELRNCQCSDFTTKYGHLFDQWESEPLDKKTLLGLVNRAVVLFQSGAYVTCISVLNGLERVDRELANKLKNFDLLKAKAYFAVGKKQRCLRYLEKEIQNHDNPAAREFLANQFQNEHDTFVPSQSIEDHLQVSTEPAGQRGEHTAQSELVTPDDSTTVEAGRLKDNLNDSLHTKTEPLVSIVIPAYNASRYIQKAVESVLAQTYRNFEIIIVDDGSTDATKDKVLSYNDSRINYLYKDHSGLASACNTAIRKIKGSFWIRLNAEDMITPDFISRHLREFERYPEADLVYCDDCLIDEDGNSIRIIDRPEYTNRTGLIRDLFHHGFPTVPFGTCIRIDVFDKIGMFDESLIIAENYDMMRRFAKHGLTSHHLKDALYLRRMTSDIILRDNSAEKANCYFDVIKRFTDMFSCEELFPDVSWDAIAAEKRKLHARCLAAIVFVELGRAYTQSNSPNYAGVAFDRACFEMRDALEMDPENTQIHQLLQQCEFARTESKKLLCVSAR